jgi:hypothetical protein
MTESMNGVPTPPGARIENKERKQYDKEFFDMQIQFAKKLSEVSGKPFHELLLTHTGLYHFLKLGKVVDGDNPVWREDNPAWQKFISEGDNDLAERAYDLYMQAERARESSPDKKPRRIHFGCFQHDYNEQEKTVYVHFGNTEKFGSPFDDIGKRKQELKTMFEYIKEHHPDAEYVRGDSWLYNVDKYKKIFPPQYSAHPEPSHKPYLGLSTWGQFLDRNHQTRPEAYDSFNQSLHAAHTQDEALKSIPHVPLRVGTSIDNFYRDLGIE